MACSAAGSSLPPRLLSFYLRRSSRDSTGGAAGAGSSSAAFFSGVFSGAAYCDRLSSLLLRRFSRSLTASALARSSARIASYCFRCSSSAAFAACSSCDFYFRSAASNASIPVRFMVTSSWCWARELPMFSRASSAFAKLVCFYSETLASSASTFSSAFFT